MFYFCTVFFSTLGNGKDGALQCPAELAQVLIGDEYRQCICFLGGLPAVAELLQCDFQKFDDSPDTDHSEMRVCACMILTNLTFGDGVNKALLSSSVFPAMSYSSPSRLQRRTALECRSCHTQHQLAS